MMKKFPLLAVSFIALTALSPQASASNDLQDQLTAAKTTIKEQAEELKKLQDQVTTADDRLLKANIDLTSKDTQLNTTKSNLLEVEAQKAALSTVLGQSFTFLDTQMTEALTRFFTTKVYESKNNKNQLAKEGVEKHVPPLLFLAFKDPNSFYGALPEKGFSNFFMSMEGVKDFNDLCIQAMSTVNGRDEATNNFYWDFVKPYNLPHAENTVFDRTQVINQATKNYPSLETDDVCLTQDEMNLAQTYFNVKKNLNLKTPELRGQEDIVSDLGKCKMSFSDKLRYNSFKDNFKVIIELAVKYKVPLS